MSHNKYPNGKLNDEDEGQLRMAVRVEAGNVRIDFESPVGWFAMTPDMAMNLAETIIQNARKAGCKKPLSISF